MGVIADFLAGREEAFAERGYERRRPNYEPHPDEAPPIWPGPSPSGDADGIAEYAGWLAARVAELEAELRARPAEGDHDHNKQLILELTRCVEEHEAELRNLDVQHEEDGRLLEDTKQVLREVIEYAAQLQAQVEGLQALAAPLVAALQMAANKRLDLPSVKAVLVNRFHPERHPEADAETRAAYGEAMQVINDAYAWIKQIQDSDSSSPS